MRARYDLAILGGGPAGLAAAIALRQHVDLDVLVAEARDAQHERVGESCPPDLTLLMEKLGVGAAFRKSGHATCPGYASSWGRPGVGHTDFIVSPYGSGWRLDRRRFDAMLAEEAIARGADVVWQRRFEQVEAPKLQRGAFRLHFSDESGAAHTTDARFVIDATGSGARFLRAMGVDKRVDDLLFAHVGFARIEAGELATERVLLEATPSGWWYAAAVPDDRLVTMTVAEKDELPATAAAGGAGCVEARNREPHLAPNLIGPALANLTLAEVRCKTVPIRSGVAEQVRGPNWMAIGDAASSFDPIMAHGIQKALTDALAVVPAVTAFFAGDERFADDYERYIEQRHDAYVRRRADVYRLEQRWPGAPFWKNRHLLGGSA